MTLVVTHAKVSSGTIDSSVEVDLRHWNQDHTLTGVMSPAQGGTGVINNDSSTITISGAFGITFTATATTSLTLPTTGTLATLAGIETLTNKTITAPTINGGTHTAITGLGIRSTGAAFDLTLASTEVLTAGRTLTIKVNDAARTLDLGGNVTTAGALTTSGAFASTFTMTGTTTVTFPTTGTLATVAGSETISNKTIDNTNTINAKDTIFAIQDDGDPTKQLRFQVSGISTGATRTLTMFDADDTIVGRDAGQTLTNKTFNLTSNTLSGTVAQFNTALSDGDFATLAGTEELDNKTIDAAVAKGTWTASGVWTIPAVTLGGTVSGGGNQINNVIIGTSTPLAGSFTTVSGSTSVTSPIVKSDAALAFQTNGTTFAGNVTTGQQWLFSGTSNTPPTGPVVTVTKSTGALPAIGTPQGIAGTTQFGTIFGGPDSGPNDVIVQAAGTCGVRYMNSAGTLAARTATANATSMAVNFAYGFDGTNYQVACGFVMTSTQLWAVGSSGSRLDLYGVANGSSSLTLAASVQTGFMVGDQIDPGAGAISATASIKSKSATAGIGYATGAGGTVTQTTSKSTGVTLNKVCGEITMNNAALAADTVVSFVLTDSAVAATDVMTCNHVSGGTIGAYFINAVCAAGSATIYVRNLTAGSLSEAVVIRFSLGKAVTS